MQIYQFSVIQGHPNKLHLVAWVLRHVLVVNLFPVGFTEFMKTQFENTDLFKPVLGCIE